MLRSLEQAKACASQTLSWHHAWLTVCRAKREFRNLAKWDERCGRNSVFAKSGKPLSLDEARAVVRGAETGEMGTVEGRLVLFSRDVGMKTFPHPAKKESVRIGIKRLPQFMRPELSDCYARHPRLTRLLGPARARQR